MFEGLEIPFFQFFGVKPFECVSRNEKTLKQLNSGQRLEKIRRVIFRGKLIATQIKALKQEQLGQIFRDHTQKVVADIEIFKFGKDNQTVYALNEIET